MPFEDGMQCQISLKENGVFSFNSKDNTNNFCRFYSHLADSPLQKRSCTKNKLGIKTTEEYYKRIRKEK